MPRGRAKDVFESVFGDGKGTAMLHSSRTSRDSLPPLLQVFLPSPTVDPAALRKRFLNLLQPISMLHARQYFYWEGARLPSWTCLGMGRATPRKVIQEVAVQENSSGLPSYFRVHEIKVQKGSVG